MKDREQLISQNIGLIHFVIKRFAMRGLDTEELFQVGCVGLCKAADGFKEELGLKFSTYAVPVILGEIKRFVRDNTQVHISRGMKEQYTKIKYAREQFEAMYHKEPTIQQLSDMTGIKTEHILLAEEALRPAESLDSFISEEEHDVRKIDLLSDYKDMQQTVVNRLLCEEAFEKMSSTERKLVYFRYFENMTQAKTAQKLDITQVQVSRMEKKLLLRLREEWNT